MAIPLRRLSALRFFNALKMLQIPLIFPILDGRKHPTKPKITTTKKKIGNTFPQGPQLFIILLVSVLIGIILFARPFYEYDEEGNPQLAPWRADKLLKELSNLDEAEQYVLLARINGNYPCYSCEHNQAKIYLNRGEIWKYGTTTKGESGRYRKTLEGMNLVYWTQFRGGLLECLKEEKIKIYYYALLPENLIRTIPLIRPPGNKQDN